MNITNADNTSYSKRWIERHKGFNMQTIKDDIALVKTSKPIEFKIENDRFVVNSICLPQRDYEPKGWATISGWGRTEFYEENTHSKQLLEIKCPIITNEKCNRLIKETISLKYPGSSDKVVEGLYLGITDKQFCVLSSLAPGIAHNATYMGVAHGIYYNRFIIHLFNNISKL